MLFRLVAKIAAGLLAPLVLAAIVEAAPVAAPPAAGGGFETAQYYPGPYGPGAGYYPGPRYAPRRTDPGHVCQQRAGDIYRIPSKHVQPIEVRPVGRGVFEVTLSVRGQIAYCTADSYGNVLNFQ